MKRFVSLLLCAVVLLTGCVFQASAVNEEEFVPYVIDFSLTTPVFDAEGETNGNRASGLITGYRLSLSASGTTLRIVGDTLCINTVVKCGFKNLVVERKKAGSSIWSEYHDYGDVYVDTFASSITTTLSVQSGYQYRLSCKHYAKKSLLVTENISNTSNIVTV